MILALKITLLCAQKNLRLLSILTSLVAGQTACSNLIKSAMLLSIVRRIIVSATVNCKKNDAPSVNDQQIYSNSANALSIVRVAYF